MSMDWNKLREFLRNIGVDWGSDPHECQASSSEEPLLTLLQRSHDHDALYRVDWRETGPELLVLLPTNDTPLKFHFYQVTLSDAHPLRDVLTRFMEQKGSESFEQVREHIEWHLLHAVVESMKSLFWAGQEASQIPSEIVVQKIC